MTFHFDPPFPPVQTALSILLTLGALLFPSLRNGPRAPARIRACLILLRASISMALVLILLNPSRSVPAPPRRGKQPFYVLIDSSRSMNVTDVRDEATGDVLSRWEAARRAVVGNRTLLDDLRRRYDLRLFAFSQDARATSPDALLAEKADGPATSMGRALSRITESLPPPAQKAPPLSGGILVVSDGRDNGTIFPPDAAQSARRLGLPVYTAGVGRQTQARDIQLVARRPQIFGMPGQPLEIAGVLYTVGLSDTKVRVDLLQEGRKIASRDVVVNPGSQQVAFSIRAPQKGFYRYGLACSIAPGETDESNNRANVFVNVSDSRIRVLFLEGRPTWDSTFLARTLRTDATMTLDAIYKVTADRFNGVSSDPNRVIPDPPRTAADFQKYDVVILGKGFEAFFDAGAADALKQWVGYRGGCLIFLRGRADERTEALRDLEPVRFGNEEIANARLRLTEAGLAHPGFAFTGREDARTVVQRLPALITATRVQEEKSLSVVLARSPGSGAGDGPAKEMALIAYQRYGRGKTLAVVGQGLWRWAFPPPDLAAYEHVYSEFWTQTLRWMVSDSDFLPAQSLALRTDRTAYGPQDTVHLSVYARGVQPASPPVIAITQPDGKIANTASSAGEQGADFAASFHPTQPGEYLANVSPLPGHEREAPATAPFTVYAGQQEDANRSADPEMLRRIAQAGGGEFLTSDQLNSLPDKLRVAEQAESRAHVPHSLWDNGWFLALVVGLLASEWVLRRRAGLA